MCVRQELMSLAYELHTRQTANIEGKIAHRDVEDPGQHLHGLQKWSGRPTGFLLSSPKGGAAQLPTQQFLLWPCNILVLSEAEEGNPQTQSYVAL